MSCSDNPSSSDSNASSCNFSATLSADYSGSFEGPARLRMQGGAIGIDLQSSGYVNGEEDSDNFTANFGAEIENIVPGTYSITGGNALQWDTFSASYLPGFEDADCPQCGGSFTIQSFNEIQDKGDTENKEYSLSGEFDVTLPVSEPRPDPDNPLIITLKGSFTAVTGSITDFNSPFTQCQITYAED